MSIEPALADYLAGVETLRAAVAGMTPDQLKARPVPGKWSTLEVVCHLADFDVIYAERIKRIIAIDRPLLLGANHEIYAARLAYHDRHVEEEIAVVESTRRQLARTLRGLPADSLDRAGIVRDDAKADEERTARRHLTAIIGHIPHHLAFVAEKKKALGLT